MSGKVIVRDVVSMGNETDGIKPEILHTRVKPRRAVISMMESVCEKLQQGQD